jgi:hypothetical protein
MPKHQEALDLAVTPQDAMAVVGAALMDLQPDAAGWQQIGPGQMHLTCGEPLNMLSFHNPVTVRVVIVQSPSGAGLTISGSNTGFGPIQSGHVRKVVQGLRARVETGVQGIADRASVKASGAANPVTVSGNGFANWATGAGVEPITPVAAPASSDESSIHTGTGTGSGAGAWGKDRVFLSYRRSDSGHATDRICESLEVRLGRETIFKDIDDIPFGVNFKQHIENVIQQCDVLLAVIGPNWLGEGGESRLDAPTDFVRIELESALARGIPVIPLLVNTGSIPSSERLPPSLAKLPFMNGIPVRRGHDYEGDISRLVQQLERILSQTG